MDVATVVIIVILVLIVVVAATALVRRAASERRIGSLEPADDGVVRRGQPDHATYEAEAAAYAAQNNGRGNPGTMW